MPMRAPRPETVDISTLSHDDLLNIALQRSQTLAEVPQYGPMIRAWMQGESTPLDVAVLELGPNIVERALDAVADEVRILRPLIRELKPERVADIGCGYGLFALSVERICRPNYVLVDIERTDARHFGYKDEGAGYADLAQTRKFLAANGIPPRRVRVLNPARADLMREQPVDLAVSLLACGFHFPVETYLEFFAERVRRGGAIVLDLRPNRLEEDSETLREIGDVEVLERAHKRTRVVVRRGAA